MRTADLDGRRLHSLLQVVIEEFSIAVTSVLVGNGRGDGPSEGSRFPGRGAGFAPGLTFDFNEC